MRDLFFLTYAYLIELYRRSLMSSTKTMSLIFAPKFNRFRRFNSTARTYAEFLKARRRVPAYRDFLRKHGFEKMTFKGLMPKLETQHAQYLDAEWQPGADWWGSQVTID